VQKSPLILKKNINYRSQRFGQPNGASKTSMSTGPRNVFSNYTSLRNNSINKRRDP
jgi:hypothetical protein